MPNIMTPLLDLSSLPWSLTGWRPFAWKLRKAAETGSFALADFGPFAARLPGSVQENLRRAGVIPDWNVGRNSLAIEWVEHRHWMFAVPLPVLNIDPDARVWFRTGLLDYSGWILLDGAVVGEFRGAHLPVQIELVGLERPRSHELAIVFDLPPEGQGQIGFTSRARELKPRYNFSWDWCARVVPIGAAGRLTLEQSVGEPVDLSGVTSNLSEDHRQGRVDFSIVAPETAGWEHVEIEARLLRNGKTMASTRAVPAGPRDRVTLSVAEPELWWPLGEGTQPLYQLEVVACRRGREVGRWMREIGFKRIEWRACEEAPAGALPWLCVVNGRPIFLQGVNWTPVRMCYMDTKLEEIGQLVNTYRDLGCNLLRVWGGSYLESSEFYAACDRAGLLVWQEFPLSSSGMDSTPPTDRPFIEDLCRVARHFVRARQHHACLLQWCGGNELHVDEEHASGVQRRPLDLTHPALAALNELVTVEDPQHRFLPTSPFGPRFQSTPAEIGRGVHHEVHGPWGLDGFPTRADWERYWRSDDSLFHGEVGVAGASSADLIHRCAGDEAFWPPTTPLWHHASAWWTQWNRLQPQFDHLDADEGLARYVEFTQREQAEALAFAVRATKARFPRCGGFLVWMGHDAFPCLANTSLVDFARQLKPAAHALAEVFRLLAGSNARGNLHPSIASSNSRPASENECAV